MLYENKTLLNAGVLAKLNYFVQYIQLFPERSCTKAFEQTYGLVLIPVTV